MSREGKTVFARLRKPSHLLGADVSALPAAQPRLSEFMCDCASTRAQVAPLPKLMTHGRCHGSQGRHSFIAFPGRQSPRKDTWCLTRSVTGTTELLNDRDRSRVTAQGPL